MSDVVLRMDHVYKKFRKGELYDSLRDLIPALTGRLFRQTELSRRDKREFWALKDVSFEVHRGDAFGIIGHNGAGKSTALKILSRILKPTSGRMEVQGRLSALLEVSAGFHPDLTGRENIFLNGTILGMTRGEIRSKLDEIIAFSGIEEFIDTPVKRYSSGMHARLGFSVAAHVNPDILIVDEVLSVGDFVFQQRCMQRMLAVLKQGVTVLFVSHNLKAVAELCNRAMLLNHGSAIAVDAAPAVITKYLQMGRAPEDDASSKKVFINRVTVRDRTSEQCKFDSGEKAWIDVEIKAREAVESISIAIGFLDENYYAIFGTSTERLGGSPISLRAGETYRCTFELTLNVAYGAIHVCALIYRYDIQKEYDSRRPATTVFVGSSTAIGGAVNCFPRVTESVIIQEEVAGEYAAVPGRFA